MATDPYGIGWANANTGGAEEVTDICADGFWVLAIFRSKKK